MARKQQNPTQKKSAQQKSAPQRTAPRGTTEEVASGRAELVPDRDRPNAWTLLLDGTPQSHVDLDDPTRLSFEYQRRFGHLVDLAAAPRQPITALHLGGGALTLARYVAVTRPRSRQQVAEIDTALTEFVRRTLPLDRGWQLRVRGGDAREILARSPEAQADLVVADVFRGARTPAHCASVEFARLAARALRPEGRYAVNITDGGRLDFARGQVATLRAAFAEVALIADPVVLRGRRFGNLVLVAAQQPLPLEQLTRLIATDQHPGRMEHGPGLTDFQAGAVPVPDAGAGPSPAPPPGAFTP
ncbi:spermidine synthase [Streptacidiphilus sp. EB103A]|uniref:spermidine synthase n=1 Tax=Streptacidiphilus sp. EB103A TaxID=3156275 RepID=UPI0035157293